MAATASTPVPFGEAVVLSERVTVTPVSDGDRHAVSGHGETLLLRVADWPDETFTVWFPESINVPELGCVAANWRRTTPVGWRWDRASGTLSHTDRGQGYAYEARIRSRENRLDLHLDLHNASKAAWSWGWLNVCVRMCHAADFVDPSLSRTLAHFQGEWKPLSSVVPGDTRPMHILVDGPEPTIYYRESLASWADLIVPNHTDAHEVVRLSRDGQRAVTIGTARSAGLVINLADDMHCLHSNPVIPPLAPGEDTELEFQITFQADVVSDSYSRAKLL